MLVRVQHFVIGAVANGVHRHAEPHLGRLSAHFEQLLGILIQHSPVFRLALERLEHGGRARAKGPIHEDLDRADAQPVVSKAGAEPEFVGGIQQFDRQILGYPQLQAPLRAQLLQCHEAIAAVEIMDPGKAVAPQHALSLFDRSGQRGYVWFRDQGADQLGRALEQDARWRPAGVPLDSSTRGIWASRRLSPPAAAPGSWPRRHAGIWLSGRRDDPEPRGQGPWQWANRPRCFGSTRARVPIGPAACRQPFRVLAPRHSLSVSVSQSIFSSESE